MKTIRGLSVLFVILFFISCNEKQKDNTKDNKEDKVITETQSILTKYDFSVDDNSYHRYFLTFDGKVVTYIKLQLDLRGSYELERQKFEYTVSKEENGKTYVDVITPNREKIIYEFVVVKLGEYYLNGNMSYKGYIKEEEQKKVEQSKPPINKEELVDSVKHVPVQ